jgi:hypothetical protein
VGKNLSASYLVLTAEDCLTRAQAQTHAQTLARTRTRTHTHTRNSYFLTCLNHLIY